jgi:hypothetical protein
MPLQGETVDVALGALNQQAPTTAGPIGRLKSLINGIVKKIQRSPQAPETLRVEKRDGFTSLPTAVRDPATGATSSKTLTSPTLLTTYGAQLVAIFLAAPFVLSESAACWESPTYNAPTQVLRATPVFTGAVNGSITPVQSVPDQARIGTRTMYTWASGGSGTFLTMVMVIDDDGTVIRQPFTVDAVRKVRVCADGTQFWVIWENGANIIVNAYDINGVFLNTAGSASSGTGYFDVTTNTNAANSIVAMQRIPAGTAAHFITFTWNGATITVSASGATGVGAGTGRVAFLKNDRSDHRYYIATVDNFGGPIVTIQAQISDSSLTVTAGPFTVATTATPPSKSPAMLRRPEMLTAPSRSRSSTPLLPRS